MSTMSGLRIINNLFEKYTCLPLSKDNFFEAAGVTLRRRLTAISADHHPTSNPYLSGDTFTHMADHVLNDEKLVIDEGSVRKGDVIYVNSHLLPYFFRCVHPKISKPYILLTHNGDRHIDVPLVRYIDDKIIHWFAQNVVINHPKVTPIPIGLENMLYHNHGELSHFEKLQNFGGIKKSKILMDFSLNTNSYAREPIFNLFKNHSMVDNLQERLSARKYLQQLVEHKFVLSPPGNGLDCHRTWEAMYLGTVPIVEKSVSTQYFASLGLPLVIVSEWKTILTWSQEDLDELYLRIMHHAVTSALWYPYWESKINSYRKKRR